MSRHCKPEEDDRKSGSGFPGRFLGDRSGTTAIEFAALALPFSLLVFAILESCIAFAGQEVMANTTDDVARQLRTGQIRTIDSNQLTKMICSRLEIMVAKNCPGLMVDLRTYDTFQQAAADKFTITNGDIVLTNKGAPTTFKVALGGSGKKNMLRVFYKWPVMTDFMSKSMSNLSGGNTLHFASVTWQNEPFGN
jgi:Flp pilus assembly protein TadG